MEALPTELLVSIFKHLPQLDLIAVTQVCKKFRETIESYGLINQIFIAENCDSSSPPIRKYTKASVKSYVPDVLKATGDQLEMLKISHCTLNLVDILKVLQLTANIKSLSFSYVRLDDDNLDNSLELPQLNDIDLLFEESNPKIFDVLKKSSFTKIDLRFFADVPYSNFAPLVNLLKTQDKLTSIGFSGIYESNLFLIPMGKSNYRLKEFYIDNCDFEEWDELETYLAQHTETLEKFTVKNIRWDPSTILNHCKNLKTLGVENTELNFLGVLKSVEKLSKEPPVRTMNVFPNVKRLFLGRSSLQENEVVSSSMGSVEELELKFGEVGGISLPSLKTLKLTSVSGAINNDFFQLHNKIQDLTFLNYFDVNDALLENITASLVDLKVLRIISDNQLTSRAFSIIKENCKNLKVLEMAYWIQKFKKEDCNVLNDITGLNVYTEKF